MSQMLHAEWLRLTAFAKMTPEILYTGLVAAADRIEALEAALKVAEAALSDIGDADREEGDDLEWCERRAAKDLPEIRRVLNEGK